MNNSSNLSLGLLLEELYEVVWTHLKQGDRQYVRTLRFVRWFGVHRSPEEVRPQDFLNFTTKELKSKSTATVNLYLTNIKTFLKYVEDTYSLILHKPRLRSTYKAREAVFTAEGYSALLNTLHAPYTSFVSLLSLLGCRVSELYNLSIRDIDTAKLTVSFNATKNGSHRTLPVKAEWLPLLTAWVGLGNKPALNTIQKKVKKAIRDLGLDEGLSLHSLRHTFATKKVKEGWDLFTLQRWLGHGSIQVTQRYAHLADLGHLRTAIEKEEER